MALLGRNLAGRLVEQHARRPLGKYIGPSQDAEAIENFLDFDDMLQRFADGERNDSLEYRLGENDDERWMELSYRMVQLEEEATCTLSVGHRHRRAQASRARSGGQGRARRADRRTEPRSFEKILNIYKNGEKRLQ